MLFVTHQYSSCVEGICWAYVATDCHVCISADQRVTGICLNAFSACAVIGVVNATNVRVIRRSVSEDVTLSYGQHLVVHVSKNDAAVVHSDRPLTVLPFSSGGCCCQANATGAQAVPPLTFGLPVQTLTDTRWVLTPDVNNRTSGAVWLLVNRSHFAPDQTKPLLQQLLVNGRRLQLQSDDAGDGVRDVDGRQQKDQVISSPMSIEVNGHVINAFRLTLSTGFHSIYARGQNVGEEICACVRATVFYFRNDDLRNETNPRCVLWAVRACSDVSDRDDRCRLASDAVTSGRNVEDDGVSDEMLSRHDKANKEPTIAAAAPVVPLSIGDRNKTTAAAAETFNFANEPKSRLDFADEWNASNEGSRRLLSVILTALSSPDVDLTSMLSSSLSARNKRFSSSSNDDAIGRIAAAAYRRQPSPPAETSNVQSRDVEQRVPANANNCSDNSQTAANAAAAAVTSESDDVPYLVRTPNDAARVGDVVVVKVTDGRHRNEAVIAPLPAGGGDESSARQWHVSPTVLAVLGSLASAGFFVVACIAGFVIADFVCGGDRRTGTAQVDQRARLLAGARRRVSAKVSPYFVD
jgi:hypothetical protein